MAKKNFIDDNPALQFISTAPAEPEETADTQEQEPATPQRGTIPKGYKLDPRFIETRNKRAQLLIQPSLYKKALAKAKKHKQSFNDYVHELIEKDIQN